MSGKRRTRTMRVPIEPMTQMSAVPLLSENWFVKNLIAIAAVIGVIATPFWFYFTTNSTLAQHSAMFVELKDANKQNITARDTVRTEFLANSEKTATRLAELNTETKVQSVQLQSIAAALERMNRTLETVSISQKH